MTKFEVFGLADETLSRVFDISSQSKQKLRSNKRSKIIKIIKIYGNKTEYPNLSFRRDYFNSKLKDKQYKQKTSTKSCRIQIKILANPVSA